MSLALGLGLSLAHRRGFPASLDLDFQKQRYSMSLLSKAFGDIITFSRASAATRINAQGLIETVAANVPRIDYDPVTLECKGLLIEEQRTNLVINASTQPYGSNSGGGSTVTVTDLGGGVARIAKAGSGGYAEAIQACQMGGAPGASFTVSCSCWVRVVSGSGSNAYFGAGQNNAPYATNRDSLAILGVPDDGTWHLVANTKTISTIGDSMLRLASFSFAVAASVIIEVKHAQGEIGPFPTSYIPTAGAQVTRAADAPVLSSLSPWFNASAGAWIAEFEGKGGAANGGNSHVVIDPSVQAEYVTGRSKTTVGTWNSVVELNTTNGASDTTARCKFVCAYSPAGKSISLDGGPVVSNNSPFPAPIQIRFGPSGDINGHVRKIRYIPKRPADAQLPALSA